MKVSAMYLPGNSGLLSGFSTFKSDSGVVIAVVDPDIELSEEARIKDVQCEPLRSSVPMGNDRFLRCLEQAKSRVADAEWDAMRKEAGRLHGVIELIPDSKYYNER